MLTVDRPLQIYLAIYIQLLFAMITEKKSRMLDDVGGTPFLAWLVSLAVAIE